MLVNIKDAMERLNNIWEHGKSVSGQSLRNGKNNGTFLSVMRHAVTHKGNKMRVYFSSQNPNTSSKYAEMVRNGAKKPHDIIWALCHNGNKGMKFLGRYVKGEGYKPSHPNYWSEKIKIDVNDK